VRRRRPLHRPAGRRRGERGDRRDDRRCPAAIPGLDVPAGRAVDGHHNQARFTREFGPEGVDAPVVGFDVAVLSNDGKVVAVYGFLDKVPAAL